MCFDMSTRRQATLYIDGASDIELIRRRYNPVQAALIAPHVTLCREDEVADWERFESRLREMCPICLTLEFGPALREGNFVYLPVVGGEGAYHQLRHDLLQGQPNVQTPHLTIIHPRNGMCTDEIYNDIQRRIVARTHTFHKVALIEQANGGVWKNLMVTGADP